MHGRFVVFGLTLAIAFMGFAQIAQANVVTSALGAAKAHQKSSLVDVRWVCGPRRCAWLPNYRGPIVVAPRRWRPPPSPHCHYVRGPYRWVLVCN